MTIGKNIDRFGQRARNAGRRLTRGLSLPLVGAGIAAGKLASDLDDTMSKMVALAGVASEELGGLRDAVLSISKETGKGPREVAEGLLFIVSSGLKGQAAIDTLRASAQAAVSGLGETGVVADAATSALNAYGAENLSAGKAVGILVAAVREGKAEASQLAPVLGEVIPIASKLGVTFDQVAAAIAAQTRTGTSAETAATNLTAVLAAILAPGKQAQKVMAHFGLSARGLQKELRDKGLISVLGTLSEKAGENNQAMALMLPNIRALRGVFSLTGENADETRAIFQALAKATEEDLAKAFGERSQRASFKFGVALAKLQVAGIALGDEMLPAISREFETLSGWLDVATKWWGKLNPKTQDWILKGAVLIGVLGPVITAVGFMAAGIMSIIAVGGLLATALAGISSATWALGIVFGTVAGAIAVAWEPLVETFKVIAGFVETIASAGAGVLDRAFASGGQTGRERLRAGSGEAAAGAVSGLARFGVSSGSWAQQPSQQVGGELRVHIDSEGRPKVTRLLSDNPNFEIDVSTGFVFGTP